MSTGYLRYWIGQLVRRVGFVHSASGRTVFRLASTVLIPLFEVELVAFAQTVGASLTKQIVLVLDRAGWHSSVKLRLIRQTRYGRIRQTRAWWHGFRCRYPPVAARCRARAIPAISAISAHPSTDGRGRLVPAALRKED